MTTKNTCSPHKEKHRHIEEEKRKERERAKPPSERKTIPEKEKELTPA